MLPMVTRRWCKNCANPIFSDRIWTANELSAVPGFACRSSLWFFCNAAAWATIGSRSWDLWYVSHVVCHLSKIYLRVSNFRRPCIVSTFSLISLLRNWTTTMVESARSNSHYHHSEIISWHAPLVTASGFQLKTNQEKMHSWKSAPIHKRHSTWEGNAQSRHPLSTQSPDLFPT